MIFVSINQYPSFKSSFYIDLFLFGTLYLERVILQEILAGVLLNHARVQAHLIIILKVSIHHTLFLSRHDRGLSSSLSLIYFLHLELKKVYYIWSSVIFFDRFQTLVKCSFSRSMQLVQVKSAN